MARVPAPDCGERMFVEGMDDHEKDFFGKAQYGSERVCAGGHLQRECAKERSATNELPRVILSCNEIVRVKELIGSRAHSRQEVKQGIAPILLQFP